MININYLKDFIFFLNFHMISYSNILKSLIILFILKLLIRYMIYILYNFNKKFELFQVKDSNIKQFLNEIINNDIFIFKYHYKMRDIINIYEKISKESIKQQWILDIFFDIWQDLNFINVKECDILINKAIIKSFFEIKNNKNYSKKFLNYIMDYELKIIFFLEYIDLVFFSKKKLFKYIKYSINLKIILIFLYLLIMY